MRQFGSVEKGTARCRRDRAGSGPTPGVSGFVRSASSRRPCTRAEPRRRLARRDRTRREESLGPAFRRLPPLPLPDSLLHVRPLLASGRGCGFPARPRRRTLHTVVAYRLAYQPRSPDRGPGRTRSQLVPPARARRLPRLLRPDAAHRNHADRLLCSGREAVGLRSQPSGLSALPLGSTLISDATSGIAARIGKLHSGQST